MRKPISLSLSYFSQFKLIFFHFKDNKHFNGIKDPFNQKKRRLHSLLS